jgi:hypothetical protein
MMLTSSRLELADRCPGHLTLPHVDEPNEWSKAGTERHAADEDAIGNGDVPDVYTERWPGLTWRSEVRYVYDVSSDTAELRGVGSSRDYGPDGPFLIGGTVDVEGRGPGILVVIDRKGFETQTPVARHPQVRFLALAAARVQPADRIIVAIRPEIGPMDVAEIDPVFDLDVIAYDVKSLLIRSASIRSTARDCGPVFVTGRHCRWCPAFGACPKQAELRALVQLDDDHPELALQLMLDDTSAPDVYELYKRIGILHKRIGQSIHAYAAHKPIPLGGGRMFGRLDKQGNEKLSGDVVHAVVKDLHGQEVADAAVIRTATKKRLEEALKGKRGAAKKVIDEVRARGGSERKSGYEITEYIAGPKLVTDGSESTEPEQGVHEAPF